MKKALIVLALILTAIFMFTGRQAMAIISSPSASVTAASRQMKLTIHADCTNTNSVGSDWSHAYTVNGVSIRSGASLRLSAGDCLTFTATIIESDPSYDDVGTATYTRTLTQSDLVNGFSYTLSVPVTENNGRYKGNTAVWTVTIQVK